MEQDQLTVPFLLLKFSLFIMYFVVLNLHPCVETQKPSNGITLLSYEAPILQNTTCPRTVRIRYAYPADTPRYAYPSRVPVFRIKRKEKKHRYAAGTAATRRGHGRRPSGRSPLLT